jgi:hypothetical protein
MTHPAKTGISTRTPRITQKRIIAWGFPKWRLTHLTIIFTAFSLR